MAEWANATKARQNSDELLISHGCNWRRDFLIDRKQKQMIRNKTVARGNKTQLKSRHKRTIFFFFDKRRFQKKKEAKSKQAKTKT